MNRRSCGAVQLAIAPIAAGSGPLARPSGSGPCPATAGRPSPLRSPATAASGSVLRGESAGSAGSRGRTGSDAMAVSGAIGSEVRRSSRRRVGPACSVIERSGAGRSGSGLPIANPADPGDGCAACIGRLTRAPRSAAVAGASRPDRTGPGVPGGPLDRWSRLPWCRRLIADRRPGGKPARRSWQRRRSAVERTGSSFQPWARAGPARCRPMIPRSPRQVVGVVTPGAAGLSH